MQNKNPNKKKTIKQTIIITAIALLLLLLLFAEDIIKLTTKNKLNLAENTEPQITATEPNPPTTSAGIIPIKWDGEYWVITTKTDKDWYDYKNGKPAYMMLNDGVYQSELQVDMTNKKLAEENIGKRVQPNELGTIFVWIPRFEYNEEREIKYIQDVGNAEENYTIPEMFAYRQASETYPDFLLTGIWFEIDVDTAYTSKITQMNQEESIYGFIRNTIAVPSDQATGNEIQQYMKWADEQCSPLQNGENAIGENTVENVISNNNKTTNTLQNVGASSARPEIIDPTNPNRIILKIINQKKRTPLKANAEYDKSTGIITVNITYTQYGIKQVLYENTQELKLTKSGRQATATSEGINIEPGNRIITIIDNNENKIELTVEAIPLIYATYYPSDGTLAFAITKNPLPEKGTYTAYANDLSTWGYTNINIPWKNVLTNIKTVEIVDKIMPKYTQYWFFGCSNLTQINNIGNLYTSKVLSMYSMFSGCSNLTTLDLSSFDTSNVTNMSNMFSNCSSLSSLDLSTSNTSNLTDMSAMFYGCSSLTSLDLTSFNTSNIININRIFYNCSSLTSVNLSSFDTRNITTMESMFYNCNSLTSLDLSNFNTIKVTNMANMFMNCSSLISINLSNFDTSRVTNMGGMFANCSRLTSLDLSSFDTNNVTSLQTDNSIVAMQNCTRLTQISFGDKWNKLVRLPNFSLEGYTCTGWYREPEYINKIIQPPAQAGAATTYKPNGAITIYAQMAQNIYATYYSDNTLAFAATADKIEGKTVSGNYGNITGKEYTHTTIPWKSVAAKIETVDIIDKIMPVSTAYWFDGCTALGTINNISNLDTSHVADMEYMFYRCSSLTDLNVSNFDTSNVISMGAMFYNCSSLTSLDVSNFNTSNVTNMSNMFDECSSLTSLDVSNFDTSNVINIHYMFFKCSSLTNIDISNFDTSKVTDIVGMFYGCSSVTTLDVSKFDTSNVASTEQMFYECSSLTTLDLSSFDTSNVTYMSSMFYGCSSLTSLDVSKFDTANVTDMRSMFSKCSNLTSLNLTNFNTKKVTDMRYMFQNCTNLKTIYVGDDWKLASNRTNMFTGCGTSTTTKK